MLVTLKINYIYFLVGTALLFLNYYFEILKWKLLTQEIQPRTLRESTIDVLKGLRLGVFTPFMIGDFVGRSLGFQKENRTVAMAANFYNSICQTYSALFLSAIAFFLWRNISSGELKELLLIPFILFVCVAILGLFFVFNFKMSWRFLDKIDLFKEYLNSSKLILNFDNNLRVKILILSLARSLIYNLQFLFFYISLGINLPKSIIFIGVNLILLIKTVGGGLNVIGDLTLREFVSVHFFGLYNIDGSLVLVATFVVWFFNVFVPIIIGFFMKSKE